MPPQRNPAIAAGGWGQWSRCCVPANEGHLNVVEHFRTLEVVTVSDVTRIGSQIEAGDPSAAERLLPLV